MATTAPPVAAPARPPRTPVQLDDAISLKGGPQAAHAAMLALCRKALPGWAELSEADVEFSTVSGGISNINARLAPRARARLAPVMLKVFGEKTEQIIDREAEKVVVVALGAQGFGPQVYALFANGRIEEWLSCAGLTPQDMCDTFYIPRIAAHLARFHRIDVALRKQPHTPWGVIRDWLAQARGLRFADAAKQAAHAAIDFDALEAEVAEAEAACALTGSPLVFGHNDLLSGNILVLQQPGFDPAKPDMAGPVCFIDYEYGAYTYRGFDIGNHFTEYAGFEGDYTRYPGKQQQELFFRHYLAASQALQQQPEQQANGTTQQLQQPQLQQLPVSSSSQPSPQQPWQHNEPVAPPASCAACFASLLASKGRRQPKQVQPPKQPLQHPAANGARANGSSSRSSSEAPPLPPLPADQLDRLSAEANVFALASHLYWGIWAVIQACNSPIDFDYLAFSATRLGEFRRRKAEFLAEARRVFGAQ